MPSWLSGAARTLDLGSTFDEYNDSPNERMADTRAVFTDWRIVGESLMNAMSKLRLESEESPRR